MGDTHTTQSKAANPTPHIAPATEFEAPILENDRPFDAPASALMNNRAGLPLTPHQILSLQRTIGNRQVQRLLASRQQTASPPPITTAKPPSIQRSIVPADDAGNFIDDEADVEYAFVAQAVTGKTWLFANREDLESLRTELKKKALTKNPSNPDEMGRRNEDFRDLIQDALKEVQGARDATLKLFQNEKGKIPKSAEKDAHEQAIAAGQDYAKNRAESEDSRTGKITKLLYSLRFAVVDDEDNVTRIAVTDPEVEPLLHKITAVVIDDVDPDPEAEGYTWGHMVPKKSGFGERAPKAAGTLYVNSDSGYSADEAYKLLTGESKTEKYAGVTTTALDNDTYKALYDMRKDTAYVVPKYETKFFYVSNATRTDKTQTDGANYLIANEKYTGLPEIETYKEDIEESYTPLVTDRSVQDWEQVKNPGSRSGTQAQAMDDWNALGAAAYAKQVLGRADLDLNQDYEWLHIKGVQNGGRNTKNNLGTGTWKANSMMIPFENQIRQWANAKTGKIFAKYTTKTTPANSPVLDEITIEVAASADHEIGPIEKSDPLKVTFQAQKETLKDTFSNKFGMKRYKLKGLKRQQDRKIRQAIDGATKSADDIAKDIIALMADSPKRAAHMIMDLSAYKEKFEAVATPFTLVNLVKCMQIGFPLRPGHAARVFLRLPLAAQSEVAKVFGAAAMAAYTVVALRNDARYGLLVLNAGSKDMIKSIFDILSNDDTATLFNAMSKEDFLYFFERTDPLRYEEIWNRLDDEKQDAYEDAHPKKQKRKVGEIGKVPKQAIIKKTATSDENMNM